MRRPIVFTLSVRPSVRQQFLWTPKLKTYTLYIDEILHTCFSPSADVHIEIWSYRGQYFGGNFIFPWKFADFENRTLWTLKLKIYTLYTAEILHTCFSPYTDLQFGFIGVNILGKTSLFDENSDFVNCILNTITQNL